MKRLQARIVAALLIIGASADVASAAQIKMRIEFAPVI
jgi:hypothetical protein